jgi:hypothetical protein
MDDWKKILVEAVMRYEEERYYQTMKAKVKHLNDYELGAFCTISCYVAQWLPQLSLEAQCDLSLQYVFRSLS